MNKRTFWFFFLLFLINFRGGKMEAYSILKQDIHFSLLEKGIVPYSIYFKMSGKG